MQMPHSLTASSRLSELRRQQAGFRLETKKLTSFECAVHYSGLCALFVSSDCDAITINREAQTEAKQCPNNS